MMSKHDDLVLLSLDYFHHTVLSNPPITVIDKIIYSRSYVFMRLWRSSVLLAVTWLLTCSERIRAQPSTDDRYNINKTCDVHIENHRLEENSIIVGTISALIYRVPWDYVL